MPTLGRLWAGRVFGTNTGNFFLEVESSPEGVLIGVFRFMDTLAGLTIYRIRTARLCISKVTVLKRRPDKVLSLVRSRQLGH